MTFFDYPDRKRYIYTLDMSEGLACVEYMQASLLDTFEFLNMETKDKHRWYVNFIMDNLRVKRKKWLVSRYKFYNFFIEYEYYYFNYFKDRVFAGVFKESDKKGDRASILSSVCNIICKEYNLSLKELMEEYTREQFEWMLEGLEFNANEISKKGKRKNDKLIAKKKKQGYYENIEEEYDNVKERLKALRTKEKDG